MNQTKDMQVWLYENEYDWFCHLVLFDGENLYWTDEMKPSGRYSYLKNIKRKTRVSSTTGGRFVYIGEFDEIKRIKDHPYGFEWDNVVDVTRLCSQIDKNPKFWVIRIHTPSGECIDITMRPKSNKINIFKMERGIT